MASHSMDTAGRRPAYLGAPAVSSSQFDHSSPSIRLIFTRNTSSIVSLRRISRTRSSRTDSTLYGPGSDLGRFLNWLGESMLDVYVGIVIRARLASIRKLLDRTGFTAKPSSIRRACEDLVILCDEVCYPTTCRPALSAIFQILVRCDAWSLVLLRSNFAEVLKSYRLEASKDNRVVEIATHVKLIVEAYQCLDCYCTICLRAFRGHMNKLFPDDMWNLGRREKGVDGHTQFIGNMIAAVGFEGTGCHHGQI